MCSGSYSIPILSLFFLYHPYIPYFLIQIFFYFSSINALEHSKVVCSGVFFGQRNMLCVSGDMTVSGNLCWNVCMQYSNTYTHTSAYYHTNYVHYHAQDGHKQHQHDVIQT